MTKTTLGATMRHLHTTLSSLLMLGMLVALTNLAPTTFAMPKPGHRECVSRSEPSTYKFNESVEQARIYWDWCQSHNGDHQWVRLGDITVTMNRYGDHETCHPATGDYFNGVSAKLYVHDAAGRNRASAWHHIKCQKDTTGKVTWSLRTYPRLVFVPNGAEEKPPTWKIRVVQNWEMFKDSEISHHGHFRRIP